MVSIDGTPDNRSKMFLTTINEKRVPVLVPPGCSAILLPHIVDSTHAGVPTKLITYVWDAHPVELSQGVVVNKNTCKDNPSQRPYTDSEWAEMSDRPEDHTTLKAHAVPEWFSGDEASILKCVKPADAAEAQGTLSAARSAIAQGDKAALKLSD